jgi:hypothetical protein
VIAKILHLVFAEPAVPIRSAHPRDANAAALRYSLGSTLYNLTDDLMAWNQSRTKRGEITLNDMQVGTADTTSDDTQEYMTRLKLGTRNLFDAKMIALCIRYAVVDCCFHEWVSSRFSSYRSV